jgi:hypothetical protein
MEFQVHVDSHELSKFKRRAIHHYKKVKGEYIELLFIHRAIGEYHIKEFRKVKILKSDWNGLEPDVPDYERLIAEAKSLGLEVGSIHTHPSEYGTHPSRQDYIDKMGDILIGVCEIYDPEFVSCPVCFPVKDRPKGKGIRTSIDFWIPQQPCKIVKVK